MKLLRVGEAGAEKPAVLATDGSIRDLSGHATDLDGTVLAPESLAKLMNVEIDGLPEVPPSVRIGPCVRRPLNFVCIGLNYADHAAEAGMALPGEPIFFLKALGSYHGPYDDIVIPRGSRKTDWEVELGIVIGTKASYVTEHDAMRHVAGYCVVNDVSEREFQIERGGTWDKGKCCDTFGPVGPWLVTKDEVPDPQALDLWCDVDDVRRQNGNTRTMIFGVAHLVSYVSRFMSLHPGDIIATGTPSGIGLGIKPEPVFLQAGQVMTTGVQGLGQQRARIIAPD